MKNITKIILGITLVACMLVIIPKTAVIAATPKTADAAAGITKIKDAADKEITRRIEVLNKAIARLGEIKKLSSTEKTVLTDKANAVITDLTALKAKIDADTDLAILKTDRQGITKNYRVFMLIIPQIHIIAASDRINTTIDLLTDAATKFDTSISDAKTAGKDVASLETLLADMNAKLGDAKTKSDAASAAVSALLPDGGVQAKIDANKKALTTGRDDIKAAIKDLIDARKDAGSIKDGLKAL